MTLSDDLGAALVINHPLLELRAGLARRLAAGTPRADLEAELEAIMLAARAAGDGPAEDLAADGLDILTGWCAPHLRL